MKKRNSQSGLTLIELLISMAIAGVLLGVMVMAFTGQSSSYNSQQEISTLQEDMWASLQLMSRDIRMAAYDRANTGGPAIVQADATHFRATQDLNQDGDTDDPNEDIMYQLNGTSLGRSTNKGLPPFQPVIDNIENLAFEYEVITKNGSNPWLWGWLQVVPDPTLIRVVKVCMQGRTNRQTSVGTDTSNFIPPFNSVALNWTPAAGDHFQRRLMCIEIKCRNLID
jgi:prepilin-type N-terminal cleavage/methylation domain-containing protein